MQNYKIGEKINIFSITSKKHFSILIIKYRPLFKCHLHMKSFLLCCPYPNMQACICQEIASH
ncbi:uncharacterized protein DS421_11g344440 [Arachis hypogaea]|nr:uncharacterized protein DS421_11g344440 [Arachis hypogaea]